MKFFFLNIILCFYLTSRPSLVLCKEIQLYRSLPEEWLSFDTWSPKKQKKFFNKYCCHSYRFLIAYMFPQSSSEINRNLCCIQLPNNQYQKKNVLVAGYQALGSNHYIIKLYDIDSENFDVIKQIKVKASECISFDCIKYAQLTALALSDCGVIYIAEYFIRSCSFCLGNISSYDVTTDSHKRNIHTVSLPITAMACMPGTYKTLAISCWNNSTHFAHIADQYSKKEVSFQKEPIIELCYTANKQLRGRGIKYTYSITNPEIINELEEKSWSLPHNRFILVKRVGYYPLNLQWSIVDADSKPKDSLLVIAVALQVYGLIEHLNGNIEKAKKFIHKSYIPLLRKIPFPCTTIQQLLDLIDADENIVDLGIAYGG